MNSYGRKRPPYKTRLHPKKPFFFLQTFTPQVTGTCYLSALATRTKVVRCLLFANNRKLQTFQLQLLLASIFTLIEAYKYNKRAWILVPQYHVDQGVGTNYSCMRPG